MASVVRAATGNSAFVIADPVEGPKSDPRFRPAADRISVCWFGHPSNLDTLSPLFSALAKRLRDGAGFLGGRSIHFEIVTNPNKPLVDSLKKTAEGLGARVKFVATPWSLESTWEALGRADAVLIPSLERGDKTVKSPNRLLEAINAGRVAIAHPLPSYGAFADSAYLDEDIWSALERALQEPELAEARVCKGQGVIAASYTPAAIAARVWR
jgi:glycosyltransferase involved in cell wall biosynthesis